MVVGVAIGPTGVFASVGVDSRPPITQLSSIKVVAKEIDNKHQARLDQCGGASISQFSDGLFGIFY